MERSGPNYKRIFMDILDKYPHKKEECKMLLKKQELSFADILELNDKIFGTQNDKNTKLNQNHRFYSKSDILQILDYQKKHHLNNKQLAIHFKMSRNTIAKWKKIFLS